MDTSIDICILSDMQRLLFDMHSIRDFEERLKKLIKEVTKSKGRIILFVDKLHTFIGAGAGANDYLNASNLFKPALARGELKVIDLQYNLNPQNNSMPLFSLF